jgi:predicted transcriptional regulator
MSESAHANGKMQRDQAAGLQVQDVMVRHPKTVPADVSVAELREHFANPRVRTALLADGVRFAGAIAPEELPASADGSQPARDYARFDVPTIAPDAAMDEAVGLMDRLGDHRLVVLGSDGATLLGLLCLDKTGASFCVEGTAQA